MNATTASSVLDDFKAEDGVEWFQPDLQLVVRTGASGRAAAHPQRDQSTSHQAVFVTGRVTVCF